MKIAFVSNYYTHHQAPVSEALYRLTGGSYRFIATRPMEPERRVMGWVEPEASFVLRYEKDPALCRAWIDSVDAVVFGGAPEELLKNRLAAGKLILRYSERIYREGCEAWKLPVRAVKYYCKYGRHKQMYMLCAGAYTALDYTRTHTYPNRLYRWGYFPALRKCDDVNGLMRRKGPASLLWAGRFMEGKRPEWPVLAAQRLRAEGIPFRLEMIGGGSQWEKTAALVRRHGLQEQVRLPGFLPPEQVREHMERAAVFLFTSDRREGWGAVLNEAMNSACAVTAGHLVGAVPFLLEHGSNGLVYRDGDFEGFYAGVKRLLTDPVLRETLGRNAYATIANEWNGETAARRLLVLAESLQRTGGCDAFATGPCSRAAVVREDWFTGE